MPPAREVPCDLEGAFGFVRPVDPDDDLAGEGVEVWHGAGDQHRASCVVQQLAPDAAQDNLLDPGVPVGSDCEQCRAHALCLLEKGVDDEAVEAAQLGIGPQDRCRGRQRRVGRALETLGHILYAETRGRRRREQRDEGSFGSRLGFSEAAYLAAGVEGFFRSVDADEYPFEDRIGR